MERNDTPSCPDHNEIVCPCCGIGEVVDGECLWCGKTICTECGEREMCAESGSRDDVRLCFQCLERFEANHCH